ncbi:MAG: magnesium transporter [Candidatus Hodarchaeaceae archaeon]|nr:magnesium transporter [Candidatus Hodarchaeaceae archaeon]
MAVYNIKHIILESYPVLTACIIIALAAGSLLKSSIVEISEVPLILMMIPPINGMGGNIGSILGARLTSALHMGTLEPKLRGQRVLRGNLAATALISIAIYSLIGAAFIVIALSSGMPLASSLSLGLAFFIAGMALSTALMFITIASAFVSFKGGLDPDNMVIPIVTAVGDVLGVTCLLLAIKIVGV